MAYKSRDKQREGDQHRRILIVILEHPFQEREQHHNVRRIVQNKTDDAARRENFNIVVVQVGHVCVSFSHCVSGAAEAVAEYMDGNPRPDAKKIVEVVLNGVDI